MNGKFFKCDCGSEGLWIEYDHGFGTEISLFQSDPQNRSFMNRFSLAWQCIKGKPYSDMIILDEQKIADLVDYLTEIQNCDHEEDNYNETVLVAADKLCGLSCGTVIDSIIEYVKRPNCSQAQVNRLTSILNNL